MGETLKKGKKHIGKIILIVCNILLITLAVFFAIWYSGNVRTSQEKIMLENFCNTVETMKQISERYLSGELADATAWASYIELEQMSMDEAIDYIKTFSSYETREAHFVDMDTFDAWSTKETNGSNYISIYYKYHTLQNPYPAEYIERMQKIFAGEKYMMSKYKLYESQDSVTSVGVPVKLRQEDGSFKSYLLLRIIPIEQMKEIWLFPTSYTSAEIGLIADNSDYIVPSYSMRSENFMEFIRAYNFSDDFNGADKMLAQIKEQNSGLMVLKDSRSRPCYWYYSRLNDFQGLDILGYIPVADLSANENNLSIVIAVSGILLLLVLIDGAYILNINRQLRETAAVAEQASHAKTRFLSSMSHDIRTPLNAVLGMTELAQSHIGDSAYVQECLRKISLSGSHLLTLINDILEISRVESGKISVNPAPFDVRELVSNLESITRSQAVAHGLELDVTVKDLPSSWLLGDKLRLTQVYLNLLNNAVKYTNPGGSVHLEVWEEKLPADNIALWCKVADTGIGMSAEFQKTMYDSFTRVADSRIDKIQGTGLGLSIVRNMVQLMNGSIECDSKEGVGTTFTVQIPLTPAPVPQPEQENDDAPKAENDLTGLHVLVAEDNDLNWEIISELLSAYDIHCDRAENGKVCIDMLNAAAPKTYDLVLMDVQMPVLNGRDATRALRRENREDLRKIPIIAMTADAFAEDIQMCLDAGMDAHVAKPVEMDKVLAAIRIVLSRKKND